MVVMDQQSPALDGALLTASCGYRVVPILPGAKRPRIPEWPTAATNDPEIIRSWYEAHPEDGVGLATGRYLWPDGQTRCLIAIDVDCGDKINPKSGAIERRQGWESWTDLQETIGAMPDTVTARTGGGGWHFLYWLPPGVEAGNDQDGKLGLNVDYRCVGGQILVWPTVHATTGLRYEWAEGRAPWEIQPAMAPPRFCELLEAVASPIRQRKEGGSYSNKRTTGTRGESPIDQLLATVTWGDLLRAAGWSYVEEHPDPISSGTYEIWMRPGGTQGSATLNYGGADCLKMFSTSSETLEAGATYTKEGFAAASWFGGVEEEHFARLREMALHLGYRDIEQDNREAFLGKVFEAIERRHPPKAPKADRASPDAPPLFLAYSASPEEQARPWLPLRPLLRPKGPAPFPVDVLGSWLGEVCVTLGEAMNVPVDVPATMALSMLSLVCMPHVTFELSVVHRDSVNLYLLLVVRSGGKKSPVWKKLIDPIDKLQAEALAALESNEETIRAQIKVSTARQANMLRAATSGSGDQSAAERSFIEEAQRLAKLEGQVREDGGGHWYTEDVTPERLAMLMVATGGHIGLMSDEGGEQIDIFGGRYSENVSLGPLLKGFDGSRLTQARVGRKDVVIPRALCTVMLAMQPGVLQTVIRNPKWEDRGLTARMLISKPAEFPTDPTRHHLLRSAEDEANQLGVERLWADMITALHRRLTAAAKYGPVVVRLSRPGRELYAAFEDHFMGLTDEGRPLEDVRPWMKKMTTQVARLAALLFLADGGDGEVSAQHMARAIEVGHYWMDHALPLFTTVEDPDIAKKADRFITWARTEGMTTFTARHLLDQDNRLARISWTRPIVDLMIEYGHARVIGADEHGDTVYALRPVDGTVDL